MRFTKILCQLNYHRHFQRIWKRQGKMEIKPYEIPPEIQEMAVEIKEGKEILNDTKLFKPVKKVVSELPYPLPPSVFAPEVPFYKMHSGVKVTEGENQALALTKTVSYDGLPTEICSLDGFDTMSNQDEIVQTNILQALVWDAMQEKLPKRHNPNRPLWVFKRQYGITQKKKASGLIEKLSYLCEAATGKYPGCLQRSRVANAFCETSISRNGSNVAFQMDCDIMLKSKKPLERFASLAEVKETEKQSVPNIFPIKPTLDLEKCSENPIGSQEIEYDPSFGSIHTLFLAQKTNDSWEQNQQLSKAIATCFAFAATEARLKYGENVGILPEPISIQCMYTDAKSANFLAYQLNTLQLENDEGIKNQVWIDKASDFYSTISEVDLISDYNPAIFSKMLALHLNGLISVKL